jgi:hypothetical protein
MYIHLVTAVRGRNTAALLYWAQIIWSLAYVAVRERREEDNSRGGSRHLMQCRFLTLFTPRQAEKQSVCATVNEARRCVLRREYISYARLELEASNKFPVPLYCPFHEAGIVSLVVIIATPSEKETASCFNRKVHLHYLGSAAKTHTSADLQIPRYLNVILPPAFCIILAERYFRVSLSVTSTRGQPASRCTGSEEKQFRLPTSFLSIFTFPLL